MYIKVCVEGNEDNRVKLTAVLGSSGQQSHGRYEKQHYCVMLEQKHPFSAICALFSIPPLQNNVYLQHPAHKKPEMCWIAAQAAGISTASRFVYHMSVRGKESSFGGVELLMCFLLRLTSSVFIDLLLPMTNLLNTIYWFQAWLFEKKKCSYHFPTTFIRFKWILSKNVQSFTQWLC